MLQDVILAWWPVITTFVIVGVWLIRMESMIRETAKELLRMAEQRKEDLAAHKHARDETNDLLRQVREDIRHMTSLIVGHKP